MGRKIVFHSVLGFAKYQWLKTTVLVAKIHHKTDLKLFTSIFPICNLDIFFRSYFLSFFFCFACLTLMSFLPFVFLLMSDIETMI